ncbi:hypothetical protein AKJ16_DCAP05031 [Drosera capensis]
MDFFFFFGISAFEKGFGTSGLVGGGGGRNSSRFMQLAARSISSVGDFWITRFGELSRLNTGFDEHLLHPNAANSDARQMSLVQDGLAANDILAMAAIIDGRFHQSQYKEGAEDGFVCASSTLTAHLCCFQIYEGNR